MTRGDARRHRVVQGVLSCVVSGCGSTRSSSPSCSPSSPSLHSLRSWRQRRIAGHGVNPADMDLAVDPGVDFYRYANGGWLDRTTIPPDFASIEAMSDLEGRTRRQLSISWLERRAWCCPGRL